MSDHPQPPPERRRTDPAELGDDRLTGHLKRRRQAAIAGHRSDPDLARALLGDRDAGVRLLALGALDRLGELSNAELTQGLVDPEVTVRRRACEIAATRPGVAPSGPAVRPGAGAGGGGEAPAVSLLATLDDSDPIVVEVAAWACGERVPPEPGAVTRLIELATDHPDALCREAAVASLGAIGDDAGLPAILAATHDKATVRRRAIIALAPFDGPEVDAALQRATADRDWQVRQAAEDLLADD